MKSPTALAFAVVLTAGVVLAAEPTCFGRSADDGFADRVVRGEARAPVSVTTNAAGNVLVDFGLHVFGWIEVDAAAAGDYCFVWGERLDARGSVETNDLYTVRQGTVRCACTKGRFAGPGHLRIPYEKGNGSAFHPGTVGRFGTVMPFRWLEVVRAPFPVTAANVRQVPIHYPYDMAEESFDCDSAALVKVHDFCKHSVRATTYTGRFIDGDRERLPYEADSYITLLGTYAMTSDETLARTMVDYLAMHSTWPTEWKQFFVSLVYADWMHSGKTDLVEKYFALMKDVKSWRFLRRADGLVVTGGADAKALDGAAVQDIVDWAVCYRDGFVFRPVNAVVNALHYRNLRELAAMARAIGRAEDARTLDAEAAQTFRSYQGLYDAASGRYADGEGTDHATVQANAMALACGVVPPDRIQAVADYVSRKGFSCSTYMAQFVLEALYAAGRAYRAFELMTSDAHRSWLGMMAQGATITMEFWDLTMEEEGRVPDMNHAWSTAPLNMISRRVLGVTPLKPGAAEVSVAPQPGPLRRLSGRVPTVRGPVSLKMSRAGNFWSVVLETPVPAVFSLAGMTRELPAGRHALSVRAQADLGSHAPETWFHVIGGNASKEGIVADLDAIAEAGISGIQFFHGNDDGRLWPGVLRGIPCLSADWEDLVRFTSEECHRRGLTFKMQNCPGWSMSGGPWITPDRAMRKLVCFEPDKRPSFDADDDYHEIGAVAFPAPDDGRDSELVRVYPNPQQLNHRWAYEPKTNLNGRACPPGAWQDSAPMTFAETGASRLDMWEAKAGWGLRKFVLSTNGSPVKTVGTKTLVFGHVNAKRKNHPAPPEGTGWECDKMDPRGFEANWNGYLGRLLKAGVRIDGTLVDSWECGAQTWTWKMEEEFEKRNGYKLRPWLPALFGHVLRSEAETERFLLDWRNTCSRLIEENYYGTIARLAHEHGMTAQYETAFGDVIVGDILRYWKYADEPMCEFWSPHDDAKGFVGSHDFKAVLPCVSAAHVYGKRRVSAEALTSFELTFDENFKDWKRIIDRHFGRGVTHIVFHTYTHNPVVNGKPPSTSFGGHIGSPFLRKQTWWPYLKEFTKYLAFCGRELERGRPVVDILMYLGDDVNHKPSENPLLFENRYKYDYCNGDALRSVFVDGGRLAIKQSNNPNSPNNQTPSYRVLWIPRGTFLLPETEARIAELERQGARVIRGDFTPDWPSPLKQLTGRDGKDVHWYQRRDGDEDVFFVAQPNGRSCFMYFRDGRFVKAVNPVDGRELPADAPVLMPTSAAAQDKKPPRTAAEYEPYEPWETHREYFHWFTLPTGALAARKAYSLSLGDVRDWATVWVNGKEVARLWCEPYECDITPCVVPGKNEIRIETVSTWYNTLVHDAGLPRDRRTTWTKCGPKAGAPLRPAGLLGPVVLERW